MDPPFRPSLLDVTVVSVGATTPPTPRSKLPGNLTLHLHWKDGTGQRVQFMYHNSGAQRDTHCALGEPWILKSEPQKPPRTTSATRKEWEAFQESHVIPIPVCYGYFEKQVAGVPVEMLIMDRIAFTQMEAFTRLRALPPSPINLLAAERLIFNPIETMATLAKKHSIRLHDWHCENIAFQDSIHSKKKIYIYIYFF